MTTVQKRLLAALAVLVVLGGAWKLLLEPAVDDRTAARAELTAAQAAETTALTELRSARGAQSRAGENRRVLAELARVVPAQPESAALLDRLDALARRSGVRFDSLQLAGAEGSDSSTTPSPTPSADGAQEIPVSLQLNGTYPRVVALLRRLHGRGATLGGERLLKLSEVKLTQDTDGGADRLTAAVTAVAFVMAESGGGAASAQTSTTPPDQGATG